MSESQTMPETSEKGLTAAEVAALTESGQVNAVKSSTSRSFADIVRANVFTLFNGIIFAAMVMVLVTGSWRDAVFGLVILINTGIGIVTELKAKRTLDKLSILVASDYLVRRDGKDVEVPHNEIVLGDLMWIRSGEQVPADAQIVCTWGLELDESMLTGESRTVRKNEGDDIYSGSTAVSGMALVKVNAVGAHSYAATLTAQAKVYKKTVSDLNKGINTILKFMTFLVVPLCVLLIWSQVHAVGGWDVAVSTGQWRSAVVSAVAGVVGMIPEGLVLLTSLNFALAAIRLARKNTLVQELESVETLARVDCLNLDKTGTVTDGGIMLNEIRMLDGIGANTVDEHAVKQALYDLSNEGQPNGTGLAILNGLGKQGFSAGPVAARVPFSSARKWSSIADDGAVWTMGAPEVVLSHLDGDYADVLRLVNDSAHDGNRVLLIARHDGKAPADYESDPAIDPASRPVALVLCSEHIRDDAEATLAWFREQGVRCRIISGDNPVTVGAIARKVRLTGDAEPRFMDARELPADITELAKVLENVDVLGRVLPDQKKAIVQALHLGDHVVAMTGDGVNDAPAIQAADIGVGMGMTGTDVTKNVADMVLTDDNFATIVAAVEEGRRVYDNIRKSIQFLLSSNLAEVLTILVATLLGFTILEPVHLLWINLITDCFPALALGMERGEPELMRRRPRDPKDGIFAGGMGFDVAWQGLLVTAVTLLAYFSGLLLTCPVQMDWAVLVRITDPLAHKTGMTMAFFTLSMAEIFHSFNMRSRRASLFSMGQNGYLWGAMVLSLVLSTVVLYVPALAAAFDFVPLSGTAYGVSMVLALAVIPVVELVKAVQRAVHR